MKMAYEVFHEKVMGLMFERCCTTTISMILSSMIDLQDDESFCTPCIAFKFEQVIKDNDLPSALRLYEISATSFTPNMIGRFLLLADRKENRNIVEDHFGEASPFYKYTLSKSRRRSTRLPYSIVADAPNMVDVASSSASCGDWEVAKAAVTFLVVEGFVNLSPIVHVLHAAVRGGHLDVVVDVMEMLYPKHFEYCAESVLEAAIQMGLESEVRIAMENVQPADRKRARTV
jgi:hypothetical protein